MSVGIFDQQSLQSKRSCLGNRANLPLLFFWICQSEIRGQRILLYLCVCTAKQRREAGQRSHLISRVVLSKGIHCFAKAEQLHGVCASATLDASKPHVTYHHAVLSHFLSLLCLALSLSLFLSLSLHMPFLASRVHWVEGGGEETVASLGEKHTRWLPRAGCLSSGMAQSVVNQGNRCRR